MRDVKPPCAITQKYVGAVMHGVARRVLKYLYAFTTLLRLLTIFTSSGGRSNRQQEFTWIAELNNNNNITMTTEEGPNDRFEVSAMEEQKAYVPDEVNTFVVDEYDDFKENPVLFYATPWTVGSLNAQVSQDLFADYVNLTVTNLSFMSKKLSNFCFVSANLRVTVVVQGSSVAQGKMVLSFEPLPYAVGQAAAVVHTPAPQATRSMLLPHIEIDPAESKTYTIDLPPSTIFGLYTLDRNFVSGSSWGSWRMKQHIINALGSGTAVVPAIDIAVYLSLVSPKLMGATAATQYTLTSALKKEKTDGSGGVLSSYFKKAASISSVVSMVPVPAISEAATLFGGVSESVGNFLSWFGYSKPLVQDVNHARICADANWTKIDNTLKSQSLAWRSNASVGLSGASCPLYDPRDSIISELASKPGLILRSIVPTATAPNSSLFQIQVTPMAQRVLDDPAIASGYELTPAAFVSYPYKYWRADMEYEIEFVCSVFHRATIVVLYDPASFVSGGAMNRFLSVLQHWTYQVNGHSRHRITIPWKQMMGQKLVARPFTSTVATTGISQSSAGTLYFALLNAVTTNGSTDPIHINVYSSCSNLRLGGVVDRDYAPFVISPPALAGLLDDEEENSREEIVEFTSGIKHQDDTGYFRQYFGEEQAHTLKELASRQTPLLTLTWGAVGAAIPSRGLYIPNGHLIASDFILANFGGATAMPTPGRCLVDYLSCAFTGVRGSYDYTLFPNNGLTSPTIGVMATNDMGPAAVGGPGTDYLRTAGWQALAYMCGLINVSLENTSPYYYPGMFRPTYQTSFGSNDGVLYKMLFNSNSGVPIYQTSVWKSGGDDFMFVGFRGMPATVYSS